ncbi:MAG: hypothetical protein EOP45_17255 [Sphingobacteriaceae bacterium]|nr:MAG: hypothetical protein EOP45_17255 [Sphingobacteriaceae bacterium]
MHYSVLISVTNTAPLEYSDVLQQSDSFLSDESLSPSYFLDTPPWQFFAVLPNFIIITPFIGHRTIPDCPVRIYSIATHRAYTLYEDRPFTGTKGKQKEYLEPVFSHIQVPIEAMDVWQSNFPNIKGYIISIKSSDSNNHSRQISKSIRY